MIINHIVLGNSITTGALAIKIPTAASHSHINMQTSPLRGLCRRAFAPAATPRRASRMAVQASQADTVKQTVAAEKVVVYSKTYCPYCTQAKGLFQKLSVPAKVIELDVIDGGSALQEGLQEVTGRRTVPQVFIGGTHVGGCDDTMAAHSSGKLKELLAGVGYQI